MTTSTTNGSATATVQTLTAEVRTLMVGSRQVTMSVFKQLDRRSVSEIELFGRVSLPVKDDDPEGVDVVGRSTVDGTLVRALVRKPDWRGQPPAAFYHLLFHFGRTCGWYTVGENGSHTLRWYIPEVDSSDCPLPKTLEGCPDYYDMANRRVTRSDYEQGRWLTAEYAYRRTKGELCDTAALRQEWQQCAREQLADFTTRQDDYDNAVALPLIVLAGLR